MKTFIKWQGNKSKHLNKIIQYVPEFTGTYIEPFVGSGAMLLKLAPQKWIINDLNQDLINVWNSVKNNPEAIIEIFKNFGKNFKRLSNETKIKYCKELTSRIEKMPYDIKRASVYMLMKHCSYMGYIIINNEFKFNGLELSIYTRNRYFFLEQNNYNNLISVSKFLNESSGRILNQDYTKILDKAKQGDFVFLDPPYIEDHDYIFNYNKHEKLDSSFIKTLYKQVKNLDARGVKWMMTQSDTKEIKYIFKEYTIKKFNVYRPGSNTYVNELLIMNY
jgi:DNA adenine methylase